MNMNMNMNMNIYINIYRYVYLYTYIFIYVYWKNSLWQSSFEGFVGRPDGHRTEVKP